MSCALVTLALVGEASGQELLFESAGVAQERYGYALAAAGDVDLDGVGDLLVGTGDPRVVLRSGATHATLLSIDAPAGAGFFGRAVAAGGDLDGDGVPDLLVGGPQGGPGSEGRVHAYSGADGALLFELEGGAANDSFGFDVDAVGDVDLDGVPDVLVGAWRADPGGNASGEATLFAGADGAVLRSHPGQLADARTGFQVDAAGDVDGDGLPDYLVAASNWSGRGRVDLFGGADGVALLGWIGDAPGDNFGFRIDGGADVDGDGVPDVLIGANENDKGGTNAGLARVYSGGDAAPLLEFVGDAPGDELGWVAFAGDVDGDARADLLLGAQYADAAGSDAGQVWLASGGTGAIARRIDGQAPGDRLRVVSGIGDLSGDGLADYAVAAPEADSGGTSSGELRVFAGERLELVADVESISLAAGGTQTLRMAFGPDAADRTYLVLGSLNGTTPGLTFALWLTVPLNPDDYFVYTLLHPNNAAPLEASLGLLDPFGTGEARVRIQPGTSSALAGLELNHAAVLVEDFYVSQSSGAVSLRLDP